MKKLIVIWGLAAFGCRSNPIKPAVHSAGRLVRHRFIASCIKENRGGENALRRITVYTPPGYEEGNQRYPVLYLLHGYEMNDSITETSMRLTSLLDMAINNGHIRPVIVVLPDSYTLYKGSFYTNSQLTGNWSDYIAKDVVNFVDGHYRSNPQSNSRGLYGISMGGNGALKIAMLYPDIFCAVYATSPAVLDWSSANNPRMRAFRQISTMHDTLGAFTDFRVGLMIDLARTYSPNEKSLPFAADMPAVYQNGHITIRPAVVEKWERNFPTRMVSSHVAALKSLRAIKLDWGWSDEGKQVPETCLALSDTMDRYGINHFAEAYRGGHADHLPGKNGRIYTEILPFFDTYLEH